LGILSLHLILEVIDSPFQRTVMGYERLRNPVELRKGIIEKADFRNGHNLPRSKKRTVWEDGTSMVDKPWVLRPFRGMIVD
jgi:hypothetical protein